MAAIDNLTANVDKLSADVQTLIAKANQPIPPAGVPEAAVQAQADRVAAIDAQVIAAITPTPSP